MSIYDINNVYVGGIHIGRYCEMSFTYKEIKGQETEYDYGLVSFRLVRLLNRLDIVRGEEYWTLLKIMKDKLEEEKRTRRREADIH